MFGLGEEQGRWSVRQDVRGRHPSGRQNLNHEVVKAGLAWWFRRYAPNDKALEQLETEARDAKRGLWNEPHPVPLGTTTKQPLTDSSIANDEV